MKGKCIEMGYFSCWFDGSEKKCQKKRFFVENNTNKT